MPLETDSLLNTHHICLASFCLEHARIHTYIYSSFFPSYAEPGTAFVGMLAKNVCSQRKRVFLLSFPFNMLLQSVFYMSFLFMQSTAQQSTSSSSSSSLVSSSFTMLNLILLCGLRYTKLHLDPYMFMLFLCLLCVNILRNFVSFFYLFFFIVVKLIL